jgi:hypothetical protein
MPRKSSKSKVAKKAKNTQKNSVKPAKNSAKNNGKNKNNGKKTVKPFRKRSFVVITSPKSSSDTGRVAQILEFSLTKDRYALRLNTDGRFTTRQSNEVRKATDPEKRKDKKYHNKELTMDGLERSIFNQ